MREHPTWREIRHDYIRGLIPADATCATCRWWHPESGAAAEATGYCHFVPPTVEGWPQTHGDEDVCSCWESGYDPEPRTNRFAAKAA